MLVEEIEQRASSRSLRKTISDIRFFSILGNFPQAYGIRKELHDAIEALIDDQREIAYRQGRNDERKVHGAASH